MGKLSDILREQGKLDDIAAAWDSTDAAGDFDTLPKGEYVADIVKGDAIESRTNATPGYRLTFEVAEGDHVGGRFWHECWFTEAALSRTKRDLGKLGVTDLRQLEQPLPAVFRCRVKLAVRRDDDGNESNRVRLFDVLEVIRPEPDAFAPTTEANADGGKGGGTETAIAAADDDDDSDFPPTDETYKNQFYQSLDDESEDS
ncbi:DUF669 domain-containing protein [Roseiconus lacunae]|uniref:DUF669 domain-containing protein n=1 Tax=Roseiconus lacunae TaxID=2605694 RepID=UPI001E2A5B09|nr:DUF669 domain-containing protein [Roseiconus lacunae]MCD0459211.1 DUF669 domain-containing protein [Roseiconus lacunae]